MAAEVQKNVGNARLGVWLDFAPQAMMRLLCRKGSDEICALGGLILTCWAAWGELGRSVCVCVCVGVLPRSRHEDVIKA